ncbi:MAG TPA: hypothetical protein GXZ31_08240 [Thermoanaerobacterales bacterium]|nr:hypothetical protein [Thermoanaerobacterales bacterium]
MMTLRTVELQVLVPKSVEVSINKQKQDLSTSNETSIYAAQLYHEQKISKKKIMKSGESEKGKIEKDKDKQGNKNTKQHKNKDLSKETDKENQLKISDKKLGNYIDIRL